MPLIQVLGLAAAVDQIGFNWTAFARARGETRIFAVQGALVADRGPRCRRTLLVSEGLAGYALGIGAGTVVALGVRFVYLFGRFRPLTWSTTSLAPSPPPSWRAAPSCSVAPRFPGGGALRVGAELLAFALIALAASWATERVLLKEAFGYLRRAARPATAA